MPDDKVRYSSRLFAEQVMPHLRGIWPEYQGDSRFWCRPPAPATGAARVAAAGAE
jgi:hypothetical protein